ncbi:solute carrier family 43 member 3 isoform X2 [Larimichthys crocea]|uniref:solute carrier family 43 member 3 isoform X2 n=1 Tax=Larimichthys crocea TaxID=215358 RepID=UPI000F602AFF|nr:solute carrier family 43 member 3 isoform X2 [Larimichthys crocea]
MVIGVILVIAVTVLRIKAGAEAFGSMFAFQGGRNKLRHWLTLLSGLVESLFFTGLAFGWASLVFVLKIDGYFAGHCANTTREEDYAVHIDCQDEHFPLVMSVASIANTIIRFPIGYVFDSCGTTVTRLIAIFLYTTGTLFISLSNTATSVLLYPAMSCLITSGTILHLTNVQVGNLFDNYRSTVINIYNGAYDSSAAVFLIIKLLHERGVSLHSSFFFLTSCSVIHFLRTFFLMPRGHIPYPLPETFTYGIGCPGQSRGKGEGENKMKEVDVKKDQKQKRADNETPASHLLQKTLQEPKQEQATFQSCVMSWLFLWHLVWVVTILFCQVIFLSTVNPMLTRLANNDQTLVSHYTNAFAFTQLCGVLVAPINGLIMDRYKRKPLAPGETKREADLRSSSLALFLTSLQCFLFCVCFTCPVLPLQYLTFVLQVVNSAFFYGGHQAFVSIAFPMSHFGKMSGVAMSLSALVLLLQLPIHHFIQHLLHGDPLYVNVGVTLVSLLAFIHPLHVSFYCRKLAKQRKTEREVNEQQSAKC